MKEMKMAERKKLKRQQVGSFCKSKDDGKPPYIKMRDGKIYRVESAKYQLQALEDAVSQGKVSEVLGEVVELVEA
jgi:hypothetical protein